MNNYNSYVFYSIKLDVIDINGSHFGFEGDF